MLIFTEPPRVRKRRMSSTISSEKFSAPAMSSTVFFGWAPEATIGARSCSPEASVTPTTRSPSMSIEATSASVRISAPAARAEAAIASEIAPMPPITWPQAPLIPFSSPSAWWSRL